MVAVTPTQEPPLEIQAETAKEIVRLKIATLIDVRQPTELEIEGEIPEAESVPLFDLKKILGHKLTEEEQEILDCDLPTEKDARLFLSIINKHHYQKGNVLLCLCNSGKRSLRAVELLRSMGYERVFSVAGGVRAWREPG
ncbi:rhodanese-like domain-containing protein [Acidiferrobacter sp.]|jgi:rhodanese-related sulfurtransferase|uniref:rhodanese-like domain-containing protein n=1 Tax=Acidiferrobacter sp. TaxID=1872107 RepID=UPI002602FE2B|nr:rhodanese-like domain-containing protein [Acidiferrobacter sp.]